MTVQTEASAPFSGTAISRPLGLPRARSPRRFGKRHLLAACLGSTFASAIVKRMFRNPSLLIVNYHRIATRVEHDDDNVATTPADLEWQVRWLRDNIRVLGGAEMAELIQGQRVLREPAVCLTFDDGYEDNFEAGRMLMEQFKVPAMFFIPTGFIETGSVPPWDRMAYALKHTSALHLDIPPMETLPGRRIDLRSPVAGSTLMEMFYALPTRMRQQLVEAVEAAAGVATCNTSGLFMSWDQIRKLHGMGHTIGAHSVTHPVMATLPAESQRSELAGSKQVLEERIGAPVQFFAYPFGKRRLTYDDTTAALAAEAGFLAALSNEGGWNNPDQLNPFHLRRIQVDLRTTRSRFKVRVLSRGVIPV
jgi:peptidoglycan/xylan/chitin deacetylase (PgdA/CDA1 family)